MILAVDIGNTTTVAGLVERGSHTVMAALRFVTDPVRSPEQYVEFFTQLLSKLDATQSGTGNEPVQTVNGVILCSVVPAATQGIVSALAGFFKKPVYVVSTEEISLKGAVVIEPQMLSAVDDRSAVGADRLVNAIAGFEFFGGPVLVVDFGTALTLDYVDKHGVYCGGVIAPGIGLSLQALHTKTAKLPLVTLKSLEDKPDAVPSIIGKNSVESIVSGVFWGAVSMVDGMVEKIRYDRGVLKRVVATGGYAATVARSTDSIEEVDEFLTLKGLGLIYERNG